MQSFLNKDIVLKKCSYGHGLFAKNDIPSGCLIIDWTDGPGVLMSTKDSYACEAKGNVYTLQVGPNRHLVSTHTIESCDYINHSCDPNCGIKGSSQVVSMRKILKGEEVTFDYSMTEASPLFRLYCLCGASVCRKIVTGNDWKRPDLQEKYSGFFSQYIHKKIQAVAAKNSQQLAHSGFENLQPHLSYISKNGFRTA